MSVWHYTAVPLAAGTEGQKRGEIAGESPAAVRASLRRVGLQVIDLRPARRAPVAGLVGFDGWRAHLRRRRRLARAELFDGLATMLDSGMPLLEALDTALRTLPRRLAARRAMLTQLREDVRAGAALEQALREHSSWFDPAEIAMVAAGEHGGNLSTVLHTLAEEHERSDELTQRLIAVLAYPAIVSLVGVGVVVFLGTHTLPDLVAVLTDAGVETPALTARVIAIGGFLSRHWLLLLTGLVALVAAFLLARRFLARLGERAPAWLRSLSPSVVRRLAVARFAARLADLVRCGVPLVEALRVLAPTAANPGLRRALGESAAHLEQGAGLAAALRDEHWFDAEFRRLLDVGQASGELGTLLERIARRYERQSRRLIERLSALLEPAVILVLAFLIGLVVVAAVLPMVRMQEILR